MPTRRAVLAAALSTGLATLAPPLRAMAAVPPIPSRFAVVDWALLETMLALGLVPDAAPELVLYSRLAVEPPVPPGVADLGLRGSLNFERLALIAPEVIYASNFGGWALTQLARIAPLKVLTLFEPGIAPLPRIEAATRSIATDFAIPDTGERLIAGARETLAAHRRSIESLARPVYLVDIGDARHVRAFGGDSLFGDVLVQLGLRNAWTRGTRYSATAPVGIEALAEDRDAVIVIMGPIPPAAATALKTSTLWNALPAVRAGRVLVLPPCDAFGGLPAAVRFAKLLVEGLESLGAT